MNRLKLKKTTIPRPGLLLLAGVMAFGLYGCGSESSEHPDVDDPAERVVRFSTGGMHVATRAPFAEGTPVKIFVYNDTPDGNDVFDTTPFKTVTGKMGSAIGSLSDVVLTGGNINSNGELVLRSGLAYHFVVVVDNTTGATLADIRTPVAGVIEPIGHGRDLLAARQKETLAYSTDPVSIRFNQDTADNGNIPHLGSAIAVDAKATTELLAQQSDVVRVRVEGIDFNGCLPESARLPFDNVGTADPLEIVPNGWSTTHTIDYTLPGVDLTTTTAVAASGDAVILPCPLRDTSGGNVKNTLNVDFRFAVAGNEVKLAAAGLSVPEFRPGYRYKFIVELEELSPTGTTAAATLKLAIGPWDEASWMGGIGANPSGDIVIIELGSWEIRDVTAGIGGQPDKDNGTFLPSPWYTKDWTGGLGTDN